VSDSVNVTLSNRRQFIKAASTACFAGMAGCAGVQTNLLANSNREQNKKVEKVAVSQHQVGGGWITAFLQAGRLYCNQQNIEFDLFNHNQDITKQITQIQLIASQDYDGIVVAPWSKAVSDVIERVSGENLPIFTVDTDAPTDVIKSYTAFGNRNAGKRCAQQMVEILREQKPAQDTYQILNTRGGFTEYSNARTNGFLEVINNTNDIEVAETLLTNWDRGKALQVTQTWIEANGPVDGIFSSNNTSGLGVFAALQRLNLAYRKSNENHIVLTQIDGAPEINPLIKKGFIDAAIDQPNYFYLPMAIRQMQQWYKSGEKAIPNPGTTLTPDMLNIPARDFRGTNLWSKPIWAPAEVGTHGQHPFIQTQGVLITQENADAPYLWGNIWG
jgi:ABC-type sugar transport system substrate-binding protein